MLLYLAIFALLASISIAEATLASRERTHAATSLRHKVALPVFFLAFLLLYCVAALRGDTGYDSETYREIYYSISRTGETDVPIELLFKALNSAIAATGATFGIFLIIATWLSLYPKCRLLWRYSPLPILSLLLYYVNYFIMFDFGVIRQAIAIMLCAASIPYAVNRRPVQFTICVLIAAFFHVTAALFAFAYAFSKRQIGIAGSAAILGASYAAGMFLEAIFSPVLELFGESFAGAKLALYLVSEEYATPVGITVGFVYKTLLFVLYIALSKSLGKPSAWRSFLSNCYLASLAGFLLFNEFGILAGRAFVYFKFVEVLLIPDLIFQARRKWYAIPLFSVILALTLLQLVRDLNMEYSDVLHPYRINPDFSLW